MILLNLTSKNKLLLYKLINFIVYRKVGSYNKLNKGGMSHVFIYILWDLSFLNQIKLNHQERSLFQFSTNDSSVNLRRV